MTISPLTRIRIANAIRGHMQDKNDHLPPSFACLLHNVDSIQQDGPQCGLVALKMATLAVGLKDGPSIDDIYDMAKQQDFTNNGELYSDRIPESFDFDSSICMVFAYHGKSKHPGLWDYDKLKESNSNLEEAGPKRESDETDYVFPEGGVKEGLCRQVVEITKA